MAPRSPSSSGSVCDMAVAASRMQSNVPTRLMSSTFLKIPRSCAEAYWPSLPMVRVAQPMPAAVTRARSGPMSLAASTAATIWSVSVTSVATNRPAISFASASPLSAWRSRSASTTWAPRPARAVAVAAPRPDAPPVTMAEIPLRSMRATVLTRRSSGRTRAGPSRSPLVQVGVGLEHHHDQVDRLGTVVAVAVVPVGRVHGRPAGRDEVVGARHLQGERPGQHRHHFPGATGVGLGAVAVVRRQSPRPQLHVVALVRPHQEVAHAAGPALPQPDDLVGPDHLDLGHRLRLDQPRKRDAERLGHLAQGAQAGVGAGLLHVDEYALAHPAALRQLVEAPAPLGAQ